MRIGIGEFLAVLLCQSHNLVVEFARERTALAEDHTPHGVVHHHEATLALSHGEQVHQGDVLDIL